MSRSGNKTSTRRQLTLLLVGSALVTTLSGQESEEQRKGDKKAWELSRDERFALRSAPELRQKRQKLDSATGRRIESMDGASEPDLFTPEELFRQLITEVFVIESKVTRKMIERFVVTQGQGDDFLTALERASRPFIEHELRDMLERAEGKAEDWPSEEALARTTRLLCEALEMSRKNVGDEILMPVLYEVIAPARSVTFAADAFNADAQYYAVNLCVVQAKVQR